MSIINSDANAKCNEKRISRQGVYIYYFANRQASCKHDNVTEMLEERKDLPQHLRQWQLSSDDTT
jgi:hypothetical protein